MVYHFKKFLIILFCSISFISYSQSIKKWSAEYEILENIDYGISIVKPYWKNIKNNDLKGVEKKEIHKWLIEFNSFLEEKSQSENFNNYYSNKKITILEKLSNNYTLKTFQEFLGLKDEDLVNSITIQTLIAHETKLYSDELIKKTIDLKNSLKIYPFSIAKPAGNNLYVYKNLSDALNKNYTIIEANDNNEFIVFYDINVPNQGSFTKIIFNESQFWTQSNFQKIDYITSPKLIKYINDNVPEYKDLTKMIQRIFNYR